MGFRDSLKIQQQATLLFTDREEPRAAFWKQYNQAHWQLQEGGENPMVLTYYGVGGIGKSSLLKQLIVEMEAKPRPPKYIYFDFTNAQDSYTVMKCLRNKLVREQGFDFRLFDAGCYLYANLVGDKENAPEVKQLKERYKSVEVAMMILGEIPGLSLVSKVFSYADKANAMIQTHRLNHQAEMQGRGSDNPADMLTQLRLLFSMDFSRQMQNAEEPLVILLDTYEKLHNDQWLHSTSLHPDCKNSDEPFCEGIIPNIPHTLWVIAGREKLKWEEYDSAWSDVLSQHILGDLSQTDSDYYLKNAGVEPERLRGQLHNLTHGTPVYLALCVKQYYTYLSNNITPTIEDFGSTPKELVERFALYMDDNQKIVVYILSCLQTWDDELLLSFAPRALPSYNPETYDKRIKHLSFIIESDDNRYNIHQTVGEVLLQDCPKVIRRQIVQTMIEFFSEQLSDLPLGSNDFIRALTYLLRAGLLLQESREDLRVFFKEDLQPHINRLENSGYWTAAEDILDKLEAICCENRLDGLYAQWLKEKAWLIYKQGNFFDLITAYSFAGQAVVLHTILFGPDHLDTLQAMQTMSAILFWKNDLQAAYDVDIEVYVQYTTLLGEYHRRTLNAERNLIQLLMARKNYAYAVPRAQELLEKRQKHLPPEDLSIPHSLTDLARVYSMTGRTEDALALYRQSVDHLLKYHGEQSEDTDRAKMALADMLRSSRNFEEATALYQQILEFRQKRFGNMHPYTITVMQSFADILEQQKRYDQALPLRQQLVEIEHRLPYSLRNICHLHGAKGQLSRTLIALGRKEEARKVDSRDKFPRFGLRRIESYKLGSPELNRYKQKEKEGDQTFRILKPSLIKSFPLPISWSIHGNLHFYSESLFCVRKEHGEDYPDTFDCYCELVLQLHLNGFYAMAQDFARYLLQRYPLNNEQCPVSEETIAFLRVLSGNEDLLQRQKLLFQYCQTHYGASSSIAYDAARHLTETLTERDAYSDIIALLEPFLQQLLQVLQEKTLPVPPPDCFSTIYKKLIISYQETEQFDKSWLLKEEFWEFCKKAYGEDSTEALSVMCDLIDDYRDFGQPEKAQQLKAEFDAKERPLLRIETARRTVDVEILSDPNRTPLTYSSPRFSSPVVNRTDSPKKSQSE